MERNGVSKSSPIRGSHGSLAVAQMRKLIYMTKRCQSESTQGEGFASIDGRNAVETLDVPGILRADTRVFCSLLLT